MLEMTHFNTYCAPLTFHFLLNLEDKTFLPLFNIYLPNSHWTVAVFFPQIETHIKTEGKQSKQYLKLLEMLTKHHIKRAAGSKPL